MAHTLTWTNNETKAYSLYVDRCTDGLFQANVVSVPLAAGTTTYTDTTAVTGTKYFYRVRAVNASGTSTSKTIPTTLTALYQVQGGSWVNVGPLEAPAGTHLYLVEGGSWVDTGAILGGSAQLWKVQGGAWVQVE